MKQHLALLAALTSVAVPSLRAQVTAVDPSYSASRYYTHPGSDSIVSFDWGADGSVYYETTNPSAFSFDGVYKYNGSTTTQVVPASSGFAGASVVSLGQYVYYNDGSGSNIFSYGALNGNPAAATAGTATNYGISTNGTGLFISGYAGTAPDGSAQNQILYSTVTANGFLNVQTLIGLQPGSSGPIAFDRSGNLFYASGSDFKIFKFTAAEVASAISTKTQLNASTHLWLSYTKPFTSAFGATSMLFDPQGNLLLTDTSFGAQSALEKITIGPDGSSSGQSTVFEDNDGYGELRLRNGVVYLGEGNMIFAIVPEPSSVAFLLVGLAAIALVGRRQSIRSCAAC